MKILWICVALVVSLKYRKDDIQIILKSQDLKNLAQEQIISEAKAVEIWDYLVTSAEENGNVYNIEDDDKNYYLFGIIPVLSIFYGIGSYVILGLFFGSVLSCYERKSSIGLLLSSLLFAFLLYLGGSTLYEHTDSGLISSILLIACCISWAMCLHSLLILFGYTSMDLESGLIVPSDNINIALIMSLFTAWVAYCLSFCCPFPLIQVPFYLGIIYAGYLIAYKLHGKMPLCTQPFWCVFMVSYSSVIMFYLYLAGDKAFLYTSDYKSMSIKIDFRLVGYIVNGFIITVLSPIIIYVNYFEEYQEFKQDYLNFQLMQAKITENPLRYRKWIPKDILVLFLNVFYILLAFWGISQRVWCMIIYGYLGLSLSMSFLPRSPYNFPDRIIYPCIYLFLIFIPASLDKIEDKFSPQIVSFFPDTFI